MLFGLPIKISRWLNDFNVNEIRNSEVVLFFQRIQWEIISYYNNTISHVYLYSTLTKLTTLLYY